MPAKKERELREEKRRQLPYARGKDTGANSAAHNLSFAVRRKRGESKKNAAKETQGGETARGVSYIEPSLARRNGGR